MKKKPLIIILILLIIASSCGFYYGYTKKKEAEAKAKAEAEEALRIQQEQEKLAALKKEKEEKIEKANIEFDEVIKQIAEDNGVVGMSIAIFKGNEIIHTANYGYADVENKILADDNTKYRIASITKVITAIGLLRLYDQGKFKLDDYISDITGINYDSSHGRVTFKHLLTHTAGINDYSSAYASACNGTRLTVDQVIAGSHLNVEVGTYYQYSNLGMSSCGAIIERLTDQYFGDYMFDIFKSMDIDAGIARDYISNTKSIAKLYDGNEVYNPQTWFKTSEFYKSWGLGNSYLQGEGELIISASDLAKFGMVLAGDGTYNGKRILNEDTVKLMLEDNLDVYENNIYKYTEGLSCHNFKTMLDDREIHGHTGSAYGVITGFYFDPTDHTGVVILDNHAWNIKDDKNRTIFLHDTLKEAYDLYFNKNMLSLYNY